MTDLTDAESIVALRQAEQHDRENGVVSYMPDPNAWRRLNLAEIVALADVATPWRCHGLAADGYLTVLSGRGGEGKSLLNLGLAGGVLAGAPVAGIDCVTGTVAIFDAENGPKLIGRRLKLAGLRHTGLTIFDADGLDLAADHAWIAQQLEGVNFAVFDSLRTLAPGAKENDADDMSPRMTALRRLARSTGAAIVLVHHRGKDSERDFRGSEVIRDLTDLAFVLERDPKDPERHWRRNLRCIKCRVDAEPDPRSLGIRIHRGELHFTEAVAFATESKSPKRDEIAAQAIGIIERDAPIRRADIARKLGYEPNNQTLRRAIEQLAEARQITQIGDGWALVKPADDKRDTLDIVNLSGCHPPVGGANP
jgi:hypothetical protein